MTIFTDANTIRSKTTPKSSPADTAQRIDAATIVSASKLVKTFEGKQWTDTGTAVSKTTVVGLDHYCTFIPVFVFDADSRWLIADDFNRYSFEGDTRYTWLVELNPQANPC